MTSGFPMVVVALVRPGIGTELGHFTCEPVGVKTPGVKLYLDVGTAVRFGFGLEYRFFSREQLETGRTFYFFLICINF